MGKHIEGTSWDSIHIANCTIEFVNGEYKLAYQVMSTVFVNFDAKMPEVGKMSLSGTCSKKSQDKNLKVRCKTEEELHGHHIKHIGTMVEDNEQSLRDQVTSNYITKQIMIINAAREMDENKN